MYFPGKVFVHCAMGVSRSGALVLTYLMICQGLSLAKAIAAVRLNRDIGPNSGFLKQLLQLELSLRAERENPSDNEHKSRQWPQHPSVISEWFTFYITRNNPAQTNISWCPHLSTSLAFLPSQWYTVLLYLYVSFSSSCIRQSLLQISVCFCVIALMLFILKISC